MGYQVSCTHPVNGWSYGKMQVTHIKGHLKASDSVPITGFHTSKDF